MIKKAIVKSDDTIKRILEYSRNSKLDILPEKLNIAAMLDEQIEKNREESLQKNICFIKEIQTEPFFYSDKFKVNTIICHIISNAVKYQRDEETNKFVKISFSLNQKEAILVIEDNGEGIDETSQKDIFSMFMRNSEKSVGSGLGLYIVKEIVNKMKGKIFLESKVGRGSKFIISLPNLEPSVKP